MEGNLTLRINESILKKAIRYAHKNKIDLSVVIEDFLAKFVADKEVQEKKVVVSDEVKELIAGKQVMKVIVVPGRLVNIVAK